MKIVVHEPATEMKVVGGDPSKTQMADLHKRLVERLSEPPGKRRKAETKKRTRGSHPGVKKKIKHAAAVPVQFYLQTSDLKPKHLAQVLEKAAETRPGIKNA